MCCITIHLIFNRLGSIMRLKLDTRSVFSIFRLGCVQTFTVVTATSANRRRTVLKRTRHTSLGFCVHSEIHNQPTCDLVQFLLISFRFRIRLILGQIAIWFAGHSFARHVSHCDIFCFIHRIFVHFNE